MNELYHISEYIKDELYARSWTIKELARRMDGNFAENESIIKLLIAVHDKNLYLDIRTAVQLAKAFDVDPIFLINKIHRTESN